MFLICSNLLLPTLQGLFQLRNVAGERRMLKCTTYRVDLAVWLVTPLPGAGV
jgi:hypothetical protein